MGRRAAGECFQELFRVLPNFHECFYNSIGTGGTCFLFLLDNTAAKKKKNNLFTSASNCRFSLFAPSLRQQLVLVLCFYRVRNTVLNQSACVFALGYFLKIYMEQIDPMLPCVCSVIDPR